MNKAIYKHMKTLHLNLKRQWFDMILSGKKKEEYREIKPFWLSRLTDVAKNFEMYEGLTNDVAVEICEDIKCSGETYHNFNKFDTITFSNGYSKNRRQFEIELKNIEIGVGKKEWGAANGKCFILNLGKIVWCNCY